ncbi:MAG: hypothetical protein IJ795_05055 [Bacteroidales bacterium]|nr:hypothetical protein [Bacteroidales bacterium]
MKRHAYLILAHACPEQLRKLLSLLDDGRNSIFVHIDAKAGFGGEVLEGACRYSDVHLVEPRLKVSWGGVSIMRATIAMLEAAASVGQFDYYHLLSGMDLPIKGQDEIHAFFDERPGREFLRLWPTDEARAVRFRYYIPFPEAGNNFMLRLLNNAFRGVEMLFGARINKGIDFRFRPSGSA